MGGDGARALIFAVCHSFPNYLFTNLVSCFLYVAVVYMHLLKRVRFSALTCFDNRVVPVRNF